VYRIPLIQKYANTRFKRFFSSLFCICIVGCRIDDIVFILFNILGFLFIEYREWINAILFSFYNLRIVPFYVLEKYIRYVKNNYIFPIRQESTFRTFDTILLLCNNIVMSYCHCWTVACTEDFFLPKEGFASAENIIYYNAPLLNVRYIFTRYSNLYSYIFFLFYSFVVGKYNKGILFKYFFRYSNNQPCMAYILSPH